MRKMSAAIQFAGAPNPEKPSVHNDEIALRYDRSCFVPQRWRKALDEVEQAFTTGRDVSAALNVLR